MSPAQRYIAERFNYKCPYNGEVCHSWNCSVCGVEIDYINWLEEEEAENERTRSKES